MSYRGLNLKCWRMVAVLIFSVVFSNSAMAANTSQDGARAYADGDYVGAANIWLIEAYEGSMDAQFNLGVMFLEGKGVAQDRDQAVYWFEKAAGAGYVEAQYNLGHLYLENTEDPESRKAGVEWWRKASVQGYPIAQYNYARALFFGIGVDVDLVESKNWMTHSATKGEKAATKFLIEHADVFDDVDDTTKAAFAEDQPEITSISEDKSIAELDSEISSDAIDNNDSTLAAVAEIPAQTGVQVEVEKEPQVAFNTEIPDQPEFEPEQVGTSDASDKNPEYAFSGELTVDEFVAQLGADYDKPITAIVLSRQSILGGFDIRRINRSNVQLQSLPLGNGTPLFTISKDTLVNVVGINNDWAKVSIPGGLPVWINDSVIEIINRKAKVIENQVQVADKPSVESVRPQMGELWEGIEMEIVDLNGRWLRVLAPQHISAWLPLGHMNLTTPSIELDEEWQDQKTKLLVSFSGNWD